MKLKAYFLILIMTLSIAPAFSQDTFKTAHLTVSTANDSAQIIISARNIGQIEKILKKEEQEPSWFTKYGTLVVAIIALFGAILTSLLSNRRSRLNTAAQLQASHDNLLQQIAAGKEQEAAKRLAEQQYKLNTELKENVAKFINAAKDLNLKLNYIIYNDLEEGRRAEAEQGYAQTQLLRNEIANLYYAIRVSLDGSAKHKELEAVLEEYVNVTNFKFDLETIESQAYEAPIARLFYKIRNIIHDSDGN